MEMRGKLGIRKIKEKIKSFKIKCKNWRYKTQKNNLIITRMLEDCNKNKLKRSIENI